LIAFISAARHDPQHIIRQRPLQSLGLIPLHAHPNVAFFIVGSPPPSAISISERVRALGQFKK
jgi:hypothetical protein